MLSLLLDSKMVCPFYRFEGAAQIRQDFRCKAGNTPCFRVEPSRVRFEMGETWLAVVNDLTSKLAEQMDGFDHLGLRYAFENEPRFQQLTFAEYTKERYEEECVDHDAAICYSSGVLSQISRPG